MKRDGTILLMSNLVKTLEEKPYLITVGVTGIVLILVGLLGAIMVGSNLKKSEVEIVAVEEADEDQEVFVNVSGAVISSGVYKLDSNARVNDALVAAGGLGAQADRLWVDKNLNLAAKVADGAKLYIPYEEEELVEAEQGKININQASISELDRLWGVGEATAKKIIDGRPYGTIEELLSKKAVKANVYEAIKDEIRVF